jgi:hypothetical protein
MGINLRVLSRRNGQPVKATRYGINGNGRQSVSAIDHCIVSSAALKDSYTMVLVEDLSDHMPILSRAVFHTSPQPALPRQAPKLRYRVVPMQWINRVGPKKNRKLSTTIISRH